MFLRTLLCTFVLAISTLAAPIPRVKPAKQRPPLVGEWLQTWGHGSGRCLFRKDGSYRYIWNDREYSGTWKLENDLLTLEDRLHDSDDEPRPYPIRLVPLKWEGKEGAYLPWRLEPWKNPK